MKKLEKIRHSLAHLLAAAVLKKYPNTKLGIGPAIENGFYYDFKFPKPITFENLKEIENTMREFIKQKLPFTGQKITTTKAKKLFKDQPFKLELIKEFVKEKKELKIYKTGNIFLDLCRGGHVKNTKEINPEAFKLTHLAGAYWRGNEKNPMLTRIYGVAFNNKKELDEYLKQEQEAKKRDHRKLGTELDLFVFSELIGPGLPLWTPKGTIIRNVLDDFVWELRKKAGYQQVDIPHLAKKELYIKSGHWDKFKDDLFKITTREGTFFALKPMNCPHHIQIYASKPRSYKELPIRYANTTKVYRDEQSGELVGLTRVRAITQDDAHVFCRRNQTKEEIKKIWDIIEKFYKTAGFSLRVRLSLRDPKKPQNYLGTPKLWKEAESQLKTLVKEKKVNAFEAKGEAAFYGPKIDFIAKDSLNREWQVATIQLDMNMPERFNLYCINEKGDKERIIMIHAAIMGSIERYLAILIEHYAGNFPTWLAPVQVKILAISEKYQKYAQDIFKKLEEKNIRVELTDANETLNKRIRDSELQKIPYLIIVGEKEEKNKTINVRKRHSKKSEEISVEDFINKITKEINSRKD